MDAIFLVAALGVGVVVGAIGMAFWVAQKQKKPVLTILGGGGPDPTLPPK